MTRPQLFIEGRQIELGNRIGKGGEGEVLARVDQPDQAVKLYASPDRQREAKIEAMVAAGLHRASPLVAFPLATVRDRSGRFAGFSMRRVSGHRPLHDLYAPGARKASFPTADYRFLIRSAHNIAIAVAQVHSAGSVIGDINHSRLPDLRKGDGGNYRRRQLPVRGSASMSGWGPGIYAARTAGATPRRSRPDYEARCVRPRDRCLPAAVYGPSSVCWPVSLMAMCRSRKRSVRVASSIRDWHQSVELGLRGAAGLGGRFPTTSARSSKRRSDLRPIGGPRPRRGPRRCRCSNGRCRIAETTIFHYFPSAAGSCLWCEMERASGVVLFTSAIPQPVHHHDPGSLGFDVEAAWRAIEAVKLPDAEISPLLPSFNLSPSPEAVEVGAKRTQRRLSGIVLMIAAAALLGWQPSLWLLALPLGWWGYARIYGSNADTQSLEQSYRTAAGAYAVALADWKRGTGIDELLARKKELAAARIGYGNLPEQKRKKLQLSP